MTTSQVQFRHDLIRLGFTDHRLGSMCERGEVLRLRRGSYVRAAAFAQADPLEKHRMRVLAAVHDLQLPAVVSHTSAAVLLGLPFWNPGSVLDRVHMTRPGRGNGNSTARKIMHTAPLADEDTVDCGGIRVTSPARTVVDLAGMGLFELAVCMGDFALNRARITEDDLHAALSGIRRRKGTARARGAVRAMDLRSESVGESRCRLALDRLGLTPTTLQRVVRHNGAHIARVDFSHDDEGIVGEFDGLAKYRLNGESADSQSRALAKEKEREERLTSLGITVVRIVWKDLSNPDNIAAKYARARALAKNAPPPLWDPPHPDDAYRPRPR